MQSHLSGISIDDSKYEEIQNFINVNELKTESSLQIAALEPCQKGLDIKNKWYQTYTVPESYTTWSELDLQPNIQSAVKSNSSSYHSGDVVSAIEAMCSKNIPNLDVRPKIFDKATNTWVLLDSGSSVSCVPKTKDDTVDPSFQLKSVNGGKIATYGTKVVKFQLGRKAYEIEAVIADVPQKILGWDIGPCQPIFRP